MTDLLGQLRSACAQVAQTSRHVRVRAARIPSYSAELPGDVDSTEEQIGHGTREERAAFWLTLDAINFGSGWFPTLRKRDGRSGYFTIATGLRERFAQAGPWAPGELAIITPDELAGPLGQDPGHELMGLFARSLKDLGRHLLDDHGGSFTALVDEADGRAVGLVRQLAGWACFSDVSTHGQLRLPFLKRAQLLAADLQRAGVAEFEDVDRLTMFADNLVPHVLRLDGVLEFRPDLVRRIDSQELILHGSAEEVEIRACALHAVELIASARPDLCAAQIDQQLWLRGQGARYKAVPRHRSRCTAY